MRRALLSVSLVLCLAGGFGACGDDDDVDAGAGAGDTPVTSPPASDPPSGDVNPDAPGRRAVEPTPGLLNPVATFVESYATPSDTTLELRFTTGVEDCYGLDHVDVVEAADSVTVTVYTGSKPGAQVCIEIAELVVTTVELSAPLGDRAVIDGSTGDPVPVD